MERPIGYWVKSVDRLLERSLDEALAEQGIGRRHWQTMNLLAEAPRTAAEVGAELAPFLAAGAISVPEVLADLEHLGWARADAEGRFALGVTGEAALAALRDQVAAVRRRTTEGLSDDDYLTTVTTLRRMAENLST